MPPQSHGIGQRAGPLCSAQSDQWSLATRPLFLALALLRLVFCRREGLGRRVQRLDDPAQKAVFRAGFVFNFILLGCVSHDPLLEHNKSRLFLALGEVVGRWAILEFS